MKFFRYILFMLVFTAVSMFAVSASDAEIRQRKYDLSAILDERQTDIWVEGERLGDLMIGSRGTIQFIYVDKLLSDAIMSERTLSKWVYDMSQYFGSDATRKKAFFIAHVEVYKPWDFDYTKVFVGDYHLQKGDVLSPNMTNPFGQQPSDSRGYFAFVVPESALKKGEEIELGYGDDYKTWKAPN